MEWDFNQSAHNKGQEFSVSVNALRGQAMKRIAGIEETLQAKGISRAYIRSAGKTDVLGDMGGLLIGLVAGHMLGAAICHVVSAKTGALSATFNDIPFGAILEAATTLQDEKASGYRQRKLDDYPEGRRICALIAARKATRKFNLVSANENTRISSDDEANMACMHEIIDMLDRLEKEGVTTLRLNEKDNVYDVLRSTHKKMFRKDAVRGYAVPTLRVA